MVEHTGRSSPALYPLHGEAGGAAVLHLSEADYAAASFLDGRLLAGERRTERREWRDLLPLEVGIKPRAHFIFHVGHCGSTLLARLLGEHPAMFCLREPAVLRDAAAGELDVGLPTLVGVLARTWRDGQTALIKATSFVSEIGPALMDAAAEPRAILLGVTPPAYLRTILGGAASRREAAALAGPRRLRLERRLGRGVEVGREGEMIAMSWLCEASSLHALAEARPQDCAMFDFDRGLADPVAWLDAAMTHLGVDPDTLDLPTLAAGPILRRYAKAPEHPYDAALRAEVLAEAGREAAAEVRAGMDWLQRQGEADGRVAAVLRAFAQAARARLAPSSPAD